MTENGFCVKNESSKFMEDALRDTDRVSYFRGITASLKAAVLDDDVDVRGYFAWSKCRLVHFVTDILTKHFAFRLVG